jgi:hypothetical protein
MFTSQSRCEAYGNNEPHQGSSRGLMTVRSLDPSRKIADGQYSSSGRSGPPTSWRCRSTSA